MRPVRSIIIYNGGSAGDFLKLICNQQLGTEFDYELNNTGLIFAQRHYFKSFIDHCFYQDPNAIAQLDVSKVLPVENSHFYFEALESVTDSFFYIDYPDNLQHNIIKIYCNKQWKNNRELIYQYHLQRLPINLRRFITVDNIEQALEKLWLKQLKIWRTTARLKLIQLADLMRHESLVPVVEQIIQQPLLDPDKLRITHQQWLDKNSELIGLCAKLA